MGLLYELHARLGSPPSAAAAGLRPPAGARPVSDASCRRVDGVLASRRTRAMAFASDASSSIGGSSSSGDATSTESPSSSSSSSSDSTMRRFFLLTTGAGFFFLLRKFSWNRQTAPRGPSSSIRTRSAKLKTSSAALPPLRARPSLQPRPSRPSRPSDRPSPFLMISGRRIGCAARASLNAIPASDSSSSRRAASAASLRQNSGHASLEGATAYNGAVLSFWRRTSRMVRPAMEVPSFDFVRSGVTTTTARWQSGCAFSKDRRRSARPRRGTRCAAGTSRRPRYRPSAPRATASAVGGAFTDDWPKGIFVVALSQRLRRGETVRALRFFVCRCERCI